MENLVKSCYDHRGRIITMTTKMNLHLSNKTVAFEDVDFIILEKKDAAALMDWFNEYESQRCQKDHDYNIQEAHGEEFGLAHARLVDRINGLIYPPKK